MSVIVGWLVSANCADTLTVLGDKFVIAEEFLRPCNRKVKLVTKKLFRDHSHSGWGDCPHVLGPAFDRSRMSSYSCFCNYGSIVIIKTLNF